MFFRMCLLVLLLLPEVAFSRTFTYGFEAEFQDADYPPIDKFPFLDPLVDSERLGNLEVKSFGGEKKISEVIGQMGQIYEYYGDKTKSFHVRMRIPKRGSPHIDEAALRGYCSRLSEAISGWRLRWRRPNFALGARTQQRQSPAQVMTRRGSVRLIDLGDAWDVEIRGFMKSIDQLESVLQLLKEAVMNPQLMEGHLDLQAALHLRKYSLGSFIETYTARKQFASESADVLSLLSGAVSYESFMPLFGFEDDPTISTKQRDAIISANEWLAGEILKIVLTPPFKGNPKAKMFELISEWQKKANYHEGIFESLRKLNKPMAMREFLKSRFEVSSALGLRAYHRAYQARENVFGRWEIYSSWSERRVQEVFLRKRPIEDLWLLSDGNGETWRNQMLAALTNPFPDVRMIAWKIVRERRQSDFSQVALQGIFLDERDQDVINVALNCFFDGTNPVPEGWAQELLKKLPMTLKLKQKLLAHAFREQRTESAKWGLLAQYLPDSELHDFSLRLLYRDTHKQPKPSRALACLQTFLLGPLGLM